MARSHDLFPIDKMGKLLTVGMAMPLDSETISKLAEVTGLRVKAVYCNLEHVRGAINRYYETDETAALSQFQEIYGRARGSATMVSIAALLKGIDELPALPETVTKTKEALDDPTLAMEEVETMIGSDPMVSAKVLKLANSAAYKFSRRIDDVPMAMRLLGLQETYNLVLASSVLAMAEGAKGFDYQKIWQEALFTASAVPAVAAKANIKSSAAMATAGLLHDIGRFALAHVSGGGGLVTPSSFSTLIRWLVSASISLSDNAPPKAGIPTCVSPCLMFSLIFQSFSPNCHTPSMRLWASPPGDSCRGTANKHAETTQPPAQD